MAKRLHRLWPWSIVVLVLAFVVTALVRSAPQRSTPARPDAAAAVLRFYGAVEPLGGQVYVSAPVTRKVVALGVAEADTVRAGDVLLSLESSVEAAQLQVALGRAAAAAKSFAISREAFDRVAGLARGQGVSEQDYRQAELKAGLDSASLRAAEAEVLLARAQLDQLVLRSPVNGVVYKLDVRLGQTFAAGDDSRITIGSPRRQARMFVESFWIDRLAVGDICRVHDPETGRPLGTGRVLSLSPYLGGRSLRSEAARERFDAEYRVAIVELDSTLALPIGLVVAAQVQTPGTKR
jgi:multidrug efflux pump subunit AcrA (membrane-fusion protein)